MLSEVCNDLLISSNICAQCVFIAHEHFVFKKVSQSMFTFSS